MRMLNFVQDTIIDTLSESIDKIAAMRHDVGEFKRNVGKVVISLQTFEYHDVKEMPSYEASKGSLTISPPIPIKALHFAILVEPTIFNFWHSGALALRTERQSARMSNIENGGLDQYGAEPFKQQQFGPAGVERAIKTTHDLVPAA